MFVLIRHYEQQRLTKIIESPFICFEHFLLPRELYSLVFRFKKNQPSQEMFGHFEWNSSQVCFFKNCLAVDFFTLGASNWLESIAPIFLNRLADFCLVSDNFGDCWNSRPNGARERIHGKIRVLLSQLFFESSRVESVLSRVEFESIIF